VTDEASSAGPAALRIDILTLFPELLQPLVQTSILGAALRRGLLDERA